MRLLSRAMLSLGLILLRTYAKWEGTFLVKLVCRVHSCPRLGRVVLVQSFHREHILETIHHFYDYKAYHATLLVMHSKVFQFRCIKVLF